MRLAHLALALLFVWPMTARADLFDRAAGKTEEVTRADVEAMLWARSGDCPDARDDADRKVCREVAKAMAEQTAARTFLHSGPARVTAGKYDPAKRSVSLVVDSCLFCEPFEVGGESLIVVGRNPGVTVAEPLRQTERIFEGPAEANRWMEKSLPALVMDVLFTIPSATDIVSVGPQRAVWADVAAYRVYDRCTGEIAASRPKMGDVDVGSAPCEN